MARATAGAYSDGFEQIELELKSFWTFKRKELGDLVE
jgi:hypothetical protein